MFKNIVIGVIFLSTFLGCKSSKTATVAGDAKSELLYMSEWKLIEFQGTLLPLTSKASLAFTPGSINKVTGNTGCNRLNGTFVLSAGNTINFSPLATTRMACLEENSASIEKKILEALSQANSWAITNNKLQLKSSEKVLATFIGLKPVTPEQAKLNGAWELNYISGVKFAFDELFPGKKPTLIFSLPGEYATGNGSCNGYSTVIKLDGNYINFDHPLSTMMACEGNGEPEYFKALKTVTKCSMNADTLILLNETNEVLRFTRK